MTTKPPRIEDAIRVHLAPMLRREGFVGSGRTFRRVSDNVVHLVNAQGFWYGGRFAINLCVHPLDLPCVGGGPADPKKIAEEKCEFRHRLSDGPSERVWDHDGTLEGLNSSVSNAANVFEQHGTSFFRQFIGPGSILYTLTPESFASDSNTLRLYCFGSTIRLAYIFARLRSLQGRHKDASAFAQIAMQQGGQPTFEGYDELLKLANAA